MCATSWAWISPAACRCRELRDDTKQQIARIIAAWDEALDDLWKSGGFLFGQFSIADCMYAPVVSRFVTYGVTVPERVKAYMDRIRALPGMQDWWRHRRRKSKPASLER